jgi:hypothetical protein
LKILACTTAVLILVVAGFLYYLYNQLNGNIHTAAISTKSAGVEKKDAFGRSPINILVVGSDSRSSKADCSLGGACGA